MLRSSLTAVTASAIVFACAAWAGDDETEEDNLAETIDATADKLAEDFEEHTKKRDWVVVPVPVSTPTFGSGLILGGAYFYPQTPEQEKSQPTSVTGAAGVYTDNKTSAFGIGHQSYFAEDKWRIGGFAAYLDLNLALRTAGVGGSRSSVAWLVEGEIFAAQVSRKIKGKWYAGVFARYGDIDQQFDFVLPNVDFNLAFHTVTAGLGANVEYDNRDDQFNSYAGNRFKFSILANSESLGSDDTYNAYSASYASYHSVSPSVVVAWEAQVCHRSDNTPLWDACIIDLRGFLATDYLGKTTASAQVEARWRFYRRWGAVAFAGGGYFTNAFDAIRDRELIPSYGIGLRFMVLESHRINLRLDYGRSNDGDAIYLGATEAF